MNPKQRTTLLEQLKMQANSGVCRAFLSDGSTNVTDTSQLMVQGGSNMTGTDLFVNKPHCAAAVRP